MKKFIPLVISLLFTAVVLFMLSVSFGSAPPLGSFFHPNTGFWANAETRETEGDIELPVDGLREPVEVFFDERGVPHIFAQNGNDLYFAQGYITARDRLFQMEMQVRAAGGTLSEWLGPDLIEYDKSQRRLGMKYGAEQSYKKMMANDTTRSIIESYSDGVNAYIQSLRYETYPLEYKILDAEPEAWEPFKTTLLLKYMTQMLAGRSDDFRMSNTIAHFGEDFADQFLSRRSSFLEPIIPPETEWDFDPAIPDKPDDLFLPSYTGEIERWQPNPLNGSNNWVVDGSKTESGHPILSNDMHLNMSLPSIWYEIQLHTPESNVYGVSLQGAPTVIVGFNEHIAWGATNTGADVMDWYEIIFQDDEKTVYRFNDEWLPVEKRVETIYVKGEKAVHDTLLFTHHGPIFESQDETSLAETIQYGHALRWIGHDPSNELITFYRLNRAANYSEYRDAFRSYVAPAQNLNFADVHGNIAMQTAGRFPVKWEFQGRSVSDGSDPRYDWTGFIPYEQNPSSYNPDRGYLSAANQHPAAENYPYYLGDAFAPYERGLRINDLLNEMQNIAATDFQEMLMDNFSYHAWHLLPVLLEHAEESNETFEYLEKLENWNYHNNGNLVEPSLFHYWWKELNSAIWDNKYDTEYPMRRPDRDKTLDLILNDPESDWFNNIKTDKTETLAELINQSLKKALETLKSRYGDSEEDWRWANVNRTNLNHLGQIPGLGKNNIITDGGAESINAIRGSHGPSWRMVVELNPDGVRGYGVYPGGQTGNPGSPRYTEFIETWRTGELFELKFLREKPVNKEGFPLVIRFE